MDGVKDRNQIVGENIKKYIDAMGKNHKWVYEMAGMSKFVFYKLLKGEGDINKNVGLINDLFRIEDPFYFYNVQFEPPKTIEQIEQMSLIQNQMAANFHGDKNDSEFIKSLTMLEDFITMIDVLETIKE